MRSRELVRFSLVVVVLFSEILYICKYSLFHGFKFVYAKNDSETVKAHCRIMNLIARGV